MEYISRSIQTARREWDAFSPLRRISPTQQGLLSLAQREFLSDSLLDGVTVPARAGAAKWLDENQVHEARILSKHIAYTGFLLGAQVVAGRDDVKKLSHVIVNEEDQLVRVTLALTEEIERVIVYRGKTRRADLTINKFSGQPRVLHASYDHTAACRLFLDNTAIETTSDDVDFPFLGLSQAAIGHLQSEPPPYGLISYKCRKSGTLYLRNIRASGEIGPERRISAPPCLGGVDFAISGDSVLFRVDAIEGGKLITMTASSSDGGATISDFTAISLGEFVADHHLPTSSPVFKDYLGNFHIPVAAAKGNSRHLFDVMGDVSVEASMLSSDGFGYILAAFPKKGGTGALGRGDGVTDGIGVIATAVDRGHLLVSNSQAGGIYYPQERLLNHEMPKVFAFKATECCYTRAQKPNMVSMDYVFWECDELGFPVSNHLLIETWDMPLPVPQIRASAAETVIRVEILKDAWFEVGKTTFALDDPSITIATASVIDGRIAEVQTDSTRLIGRRITFETKSLFYWHEGSAIIE